MLQFITHFTDSISYLDSVKIALQGGCKWIQLRMKHASIDEIRPIALQAQSLCRESGSTFIIDDHVDLVKEINADGVHLGKNDMPIDQARHILGERFIIGGTANTFEDIEKHYRNGANYIGCGPFRFTTTKEKLSPILGIKGYEEIISQMKNEKIKLPIIAIGGITAEDIPNLMKTGITGIALSGTVIRAKNPVAEMQKLINLL